MKTTIDISRIKINYNIFFKNFFNKSILVNRAKKELLLDFKYKENDLGFQKKKFKRGLYCYNLNKYRNIAIIIKNNLLWRKFYNDYLVNLGNILDLGK